MTSHLRDAAAVDPRVSPTPDQRPVRQYLLVVFVAALTVRLGASVVTGPRLGVDSAEYIAWGRALVSAGPTSVTGVRIEHAPLYGVFLALGALLPTIDVAWFAVLSQCLLGAATALLLARLTTRETGSRLAGLCAGGLAALHISFVFWTAYVLSEVLFLFLLTVCADRGLLLRRSRHPARDAAVVGVLGLLAVAARPTGVVFLLALLLLVAQLARGISGRAGPLLVGFSAPFAVVAIVLASGPLVGRPALQPTLAYLGTWVDSAVLSGLLWTDAGRATAGVDLDVDPPPVVATLPPEQRPEFLAVGARGFAARHPEFVVAQGGRKLRAFWSPVMPEYSLAHAVTQGLYFGAFYLLAIIGGAHMGRARALLTLVIASVALFTLTSVVTFVDYDQRYRLPAELFLMPPAGAGLAWLLTRVASAAHTTVRRRARAGE